jgi:hypothetical protein
VARSCADVDGNVAPSADRLLLASYIGEGVLLSCRMGKLIDRDSGGIGAPLLVIGTAGVATALPGPVAAPRPLPSHATELACTREAELPCVGGV